MVKVSVLITAATAVATSSGVAKRPNGVRAACSSCQAWSSDFHEPVSTRSRRDRYHADAAPVPARGRATAKVMLSSAALDAQYIKDCSRSPIFPAADERFTTTPPPGRACSFSSSGRNARTTGERTANVGRENGVDQRIVERVEIGVFHETCGASAVHQCIAMREALRQKRGEPALSVTGAERAECPAPGKDFASRSAASAERL